MKVKFGDATLDMRSVWYDRENRSVGFIDQRKLPHSIETYEATRYPEVAFAIKDMVVRGAPAIGVAAAYGMALGYHEREVERAAELIKSTRPTAHDLFHAVDYMLDSIRNGKNPEDAAESYVMRTLDACERIGKHGNELIEDGMRILTHCNAGALATVDYGTALAPIRLAHREGKRIFVWVDETRPRLQGASLTAWELLNEGIEHAIIADNAAGYFMRKGEIDMVIVGADRISMNGDFANKIGTYEKALLARENGIPFYVAAPMSTFDPEIESGDDIVVEERSEDEVLYAGDCRIAPEGSHARNPAFDVTPAKYVTGFITEKGIIKPSEIGEYLKD
jgi:S-methyl-5-thioribose-1-phosphate isomerase